MTARAVWAGDTASTDRALAEYVAAPDESFGWTVRRQGDAPQGPWAELTLSSQNWQKTAWKHQLFILKPKEVRDGRRALLVIGGGSWKPELAQPPAAGEEMPGQVAMYVALAENLGTPVAVLLQVPHQPLNNLREDALISHTFEQFFKTNDATWPLLLPMVKSAVAGMTAVEQFAKREWSLEIDEFTLTGGSKRGWTTWLTAAVDPRVTALAPAVIDTLNMSKQLPHQIVTWGKPSEQIHDYTDRGLHKVLLTPRGQQLVRIVDPYHYRDAITQPKLIVLGTNDRYWPLDALNLYWSDLPGKKYVLYVPNKGHGLGDLERTLGTLTALHRQAAGELELADLDWQFSEEAGRVRLTLKASTPPRSVSAWLAESPTRDFRDARWSSQPMQANGDGHEFVLPHKPEGLQAIFGEAVFDTDRVPYFLSTNVKIVGQPAKATGTQP
ncbi:MAG TPA: PhoPQ-activated protein PqaA family protein [Pirellulales bacterium]|jgi:PhoPQ-activated pathogenicity-related protein|nr:PhoPQ-activated protein PqaA family protein [Pirellulales bacterium]